MKQRDLVNSAKRAIVDLDSSNGPEYTPNMNQGSIFRIEDSTDITLNNPSNLRDGLYIRLEIVTGTTDGIAFGSAYTIGGSPITSVVNSNGIYIIEGRYSTLTNTLLMREV